MRARIIWTALLAMACGAPARPVELVEPRVERPAPPRAAEGPAPRRLALSPAMQWRIESDGVCAIGSDARVRCWGSAWTITPTTVSWIEDAVEVAATPGIACARLEAGEVHCFSDLEDPAQRIRIGVDDAIALASTGEELCAVRASGRIACWGGAYDNVGGPPQSWRDLGDPRTRVGRPVVDERWARVTERDGVIDALALRSTPGGWCALRRSGALACWGAVSVPGHERPFDERAHEVFAVPGIEDAKDLSFATNDVCVLRRGGGVICTGQSTRGVPLVVIRPGARTSLPAPEGWGLMPDSQGVHTLLPGAGDLGASFCGWDEERLRCWPRVTERSRTWAVLFGQTVSLDPVPFELLPGRRLREIGYLAGEDFDAEAGAGCALFETGPARCWGPREILGRPIVSSTRRPRPVPGLRGVTWISAAGDDTCAGDDSGAAWCWGGGGWMERSYSEERERVPSPQALDGGRGRVWVAAGTLCRAEGGRLHCRGELARRARQAQAAADAIEVDETSETAASWEVPGLTPESIAVGSAQVCSFAGGRLRCVGRSPVAASASDAFDDARAVAVPRLADVVDVDIDGDVGCAVRRDGRVSCFGRYAFGRAPEDGAGPRSIQGVAGATEVATGRSHACALTPGAVWCWNDETAEVLDGVVDPIALDHGEHHLCVIERGGAVVCAGGNQRGQTGQPEGVLRGRVEGLPPASQIALGARHSCALVEGGRVYCWGDDESEQLGDGPQLRYSAAPLPVEGTE